MKVKFTITLTCDLPYPNVDAYPGCSTPEMAVDMEKEAFKQDPISWMEALIDSSNDVSLKGEVLDGVDTDTLIDKLNSRLNMISTEIADIEDKYHTSGDKIDDRCISLRKEYAETYTQLIQLRRRKIFL